MITRRHVLGAALLGFTVWLGIEFSVEVAFLFVVGVFLTAALFLD
jgi:hypothetical protein